MDEMNPPNVIDFESLRSDIRELKKELAEHRKTLHEVDKIAAVRISVLETRFAYIAGKISAIVALFVSILTAAVTRLFF